MDFVYFAKQLNHEIAHLEAQLAEKRTAVGKLMALFSPQEKTQIENADAEDKAPKRK